MAVLQKLNLHANILFFTSSLLIAAEWQSAKMSSDMKVYERFMTLDLPMWGKRKMQLLMVNSYRDQSVRVCVCIHS